MEKRELICIGCPLGCMVTSVVLRGKAGLTQMERWLRGLNWLRESGLIWWNIVVLTDELEDETLEYVRDMEQQGYIKGLTKEQWKDWVDS